MTKVNRHRTYGMTPEWRIIANSLNEKRVPTARIIGISNIWQSERPRGLIRRCRVRIYPSGYRQGYSLCSHSNNVLASRPRFLFDLLPHLFPNGAERVFASTPVSHVRYLTRQNWQSWRFFCWATTARP
jgi:hypothetical protein